MADKKKTNTKKNVVFESLDMDLNKGTDLKAGEEAVQKKTSSTPPPKKETVKKAAAPSKAAKKEKKEELVRTTIDLPKSEHRKLKILAMNSDTRLYQYLYNIVKEHLDKF